MFGEEPGMCFLKLSDAFEPELLSEPMLEGKAKMLNINYGHNEKLVKDCKHLHDYAYFLISWDNKTLSHFIS